MPSETLTMIVEALPLGERYAAELAAAESAIVAERASAIGILFPFELAPTTADAIAEYQFHTSRLGAAGYGDRLAEIHGRAVATHPEFARLLRSTDAIADVEAAAAQLAAPMSTLETHATAQVRAAAAARQRYEIAIARQCAAVEGHDLAPAARDLLACEACAARIAVAKARLEEHAAAELARAAADRRAIARTVVGRTVSRVREAERVATDALAQATLSANEYRQVRADAIVERIRASGLAEIRVGSELYEAEGVARSAHGLSLESLSRFEAAITAHEGS